MQFILRKRTASHDIFCYRLINILQLFVIRNLCFDIYALGSKNPSTGNLAPESYANGITKKEITL